MKRTRTPAPALSLPALSLPAFTLEGGLLLPGQLEKIARGRASAQREADYHLPKGIKLKDEYSRAFQIARAQWQHFSAQMERADVDAAHITTTFIHELLRDAFGYAALQPVQGQQAGQLRYPVSFMTGEMPVLVAPHTCGLDDADIPFAVHGSGNRKKSPFQAMQELLNASDRLQWGLVSNGRQLRLARETTSLTRPHFLEIDLTDLLGGARYDEFAGVWHVLHASRAPHSGQNAACIWEHWRNEGHQEGERIREGLRGGVEQALLTFGAGFLKHPRNHALREALHTGALRHDGYFQQLLRLIYRLIFLFTIEERGLLHPHDDSEAAHTARRAYAGGYALSRLRGMCLKRRAHTRHDDQWQAIRIVFRGLVQGEPRLALPALGGLFTPGQCPDLDASSLDNGHLLRALYHLRWAKTDDLQRLVPVDYRNMGPEELGSVYESLLELVPSIDTAARSFGFVGLTEQGSTVGNARKLSGSYYTPDGLVQELIKSALDPVIEQRLAANPANPTAALLSIRVIDPACGSGHFLLAAARRLADTRARLRSHDGEQEGALNAQNYRHALREVTACCIFGIDRNPMAIELARMALWLEGFEQGRPLSFLDHHLQVGDALLGLMELDALKHGIAKDAFKPLSGDDKDTCKVLTKTNAAALKQMEKDLKGPQTLFTFDDHSALATLRGIDTLPGDTPADVAAKEQAWRQFLQASAHTPLAQAADVWMGAYLLPKTPAAPIPTSATLHLLLIAPELAQDPIHASAIAAAQRACREAHVLHWPLAFPQVFAQGGFDCVLGNPPWERITLKEEEFFASRHPDIAGARNKAERARCIEWLGEGMLARQLHPELPHDTDKDITEKQLHHDFISARRRAEAASAFSHVKAQEGGRYPLTGVGDVNVYALFAETILGLLHASGRAGFIVPTGIATDDSTKAYFGHITQHRRLVSLYDIENREAIFPSVHRSYKFCLLTLGKAEQAEFVCFVTQVNQLSDSRRRFTLTPEEFRLINPNTLTCPIFRSERDAELTKKLYRAAPVLIRDSVIAGKGKTLQAEQNPWGMTFMRMLDMSNDSHLFKAAPAQNRLPLYEAKLIHHFDHRWASYQENGKTRDVTLDEKKDPDFTITPRYWVDQNQVQECLRKRDRAGNLIWQWKRAWLLGWRDICRATDERTVIATVLPVVGVGHTMPLMFPGKNITAQQTAALLGNLTSHTLDFVARQKIGGTHLTIFTLKQLPILPPDRYTQTDLDFIVPRVLELTYTTHDLAAWAQDLDHDGLPFTFDPDRRALLRAELDAWYARLYALTRDELSYILDPVDIMGEDYPSETFRVLKHNELKTFGEYRTQRLALEAWDSLDVQRILTMPASEPIRRATPFPVYAQSTTPASEAEDWLAGVIYDILLQEGACDDNRLRLILGARLPENTPHAEELKIWLKSVDTNRYPQIFNWLRDLLGAPKTTPLSIRKPEAGVHLLGDHRTASLARALIAACESQEAALKKILAEPASITHPDELRKQG